MRLFSRKKKARRKGASGEDTPVDPLSPRRAGLSDVADVRQSREEAIARPVKPTRPGSAKADGEEGAAAPKKRRVNPGATRLMGFDTSDGRVVDLFNEESAEKAQIGRCSHPVAWALVIKGPGQGECFALRTGMSQIGRGEDQAVCLDFGDQAISRTNHAAIVYDPKAHNFLLGHGGKANIVRLNGTPVVSTTEITDGDRIELGETTLLFKALCTPEFNWTDIDNEVDEGDDDDVEIA